MSRGPGRMMRYALDHLTQDRFWARPENAEHWHPLHVAAWSYEKNRLTAELGRELEWGEGAAVCVTASLTESMRRAVRALERDGLVKTCQLWYDPDDDTRRRWSGLHYRLSAQGREKLSVGNCPTLTPEEAGEAVQQLADLLGGAS